MNEARPLARHVDLVRVRDGARAKARDGVRVGARARVRIRARVRARVRPRHANLLEWVVFQVVELHRIAVGLLVQLVRSPDHALARGVEDP